MIHQMLLGLGGNVHIEVSLFMIQVSKLVIYVFFIYT